MEPTELDEVIRKRLREITIKRKKNPILFRRILEEISRELTAK